MKQVEANINKEGKRSLDRKKIKERKRNENKET